MIYGELPTTGAVFAACDSKYFMDHAGPFLYSASENGFNVHIHVVNPTNEVLSYAAILSSTSQTHTTFTFHDVDLGKLSGEERRAYYACARFQVAPHILRFAERLLVLDIDCLIMRPFEFPNKPIGYFPRESLPGTTGWEAEGTKVAAGAVYFGKHATAQKVCTAIGQAIDQLPLQWFNDQIALSHAMKQLPDDYVEKFDGEFMDWEFKQGTAIWTGKGPRKYDNPTYVAEKNRMDKAKEYTKDKDTIILAPRLDLMFKRSGVDYAKGSIEPIRIHWGNFIDKLASIRADHMHTTPLIIQAPRWFFNESICEWFDEEKCMIYVPHSEKSIWGGGDNCRYYMQTVFPWLFTIDKKGWGGGSSYKEWFDPAKETENGSYKSMQEYIEKGNTKFKHLQPETEWEPKEEYVFMPLQLPHDETIKYHSDVTVPEVVKAMCEWADNGGKKVVFKGHPVNIGSMEPLVEIINQYKNVQYVTDVDINEGIKKSLAVYVVNSGTGQESMLHGKPVVTFGRCDYEAVTIHGDINNLSETWEQVANDDNEERVQLYSKWYDWFLTDVTFNTRKEKNA